MKWVVYRRLFDFIRLHSNLTIQHVQGRFPRLPSFPSQVPYAMEKLYGDHDRFRQASLERRTALQAYLRDVISKLNIQISYSMCEFLEISALSIHRDTGWKGKEGRLERNVKVATYKFLPSTRWREHWVMCRDSYMVFSEGVADTAATDVLLFDGTIKVDYKVQNSRNPFEQLQLTLSTSQRQIKLRGAHHMDMNLWLESLQKAIASSPFTKEHRYGSFAPVRENMKARWYSDAEEYYWMVSESIDKAKDVIYIEDWWLSPQLVNAVPTREVPAAFC